MDRETSTAPSEPLVTTPPGAVIFDMDGVLIDSEPLHQQVEQQIFREAGICLSAREHARFLGMSSPNMWDLVRRNYGVKTPQEELLQREQELYQAILEQQGVPLVPGVEALLEQLQCRGIPRAIASSAPMEQIEYTLANTPLGRFFSVTVSGAGLPRSKPDPEIFLLAARDLGYAPEECLVIEDAPAGVAAAGAAGMTCIGFANPHSGEVDLSAADRVCHSMEEVAALLNL
ncbi:haloacid dehalogenase superfamily, subfamily IA, variant 3 with third motif having DD or ED [Alkalispirochaeta americana]|uniref:Haloacid dehalogenase superfamily, subfamily IA, variant 3 with third motif having DD or ED n=1 Tax=Alkalispirochaeta americana TaxID=159291 RepID=A0A1N6RAF3_9SPIO|nr:HAD family phosphatase [Alkalispirochaeta americana]SIQ25818.1 haloacid dehalogenase superfamily, subfamily IA, variant 3 with third motif having DD or ED [Alkalispirochaeta americana]